MIDQKHPIANLTTLLKKHHAFTWKNLSRISLFYLKLLLQEPMRILEEVNYAEAVDSHQLTKDPLFIIGHWRSGTSFLQYLLGQDPQFGYMNKFQVVFPDIFLYSESFLKPLIQKLPRTFNITRDAKNMSINLELDSPSEIEIALTTMISPSSLHWGHIFPEDGREYFDKYLFLEKAGKDEIRQWEKDYRHLVRKVSLNNQGRQILLKSPGNACRMEKLLDLYPGAQFIFIHRNPYDVFYSSKKLWRTLLDNLALQAFCRTQMENEIIRLYARLMGNYLVQKEQVPAGQLHEIRFADFVQEPVDELKKAYHKLNLNGFEKAEVKFREFLDQKAQGKSSSYEYENRVINRLNTEWKFAFEEWDYTMLDKAT